MTFLVRRLRSLGSMLDELTPHAAATLLALGFVLGTFPMYGLPTGLCLAAAFILRRNAATLQLVNQAASPLQALLFIPFLRIGEGLLGRSLSAGSPAARLTACTTRAVAGWFCLALPLGVILYFLCVHLLRRRPRQCFNTV